MSNSGLEHEISELRDALNEAHDICVAIRQGDVDAVVVGRTDEEKRVLLLSGAYARYRQLVEQMQQGAVTLSASGEIVFANQGFARLVGVQPAHLFRQPLEGYVAAADRGKVAEMLEPKVPRHTAEVQLLRDNGTQARVRLNLVDNGEEFTTLLVTDLSRDAQEARETGEDAHAILDAIRGGAVDAFVVGGRQVVMLDSAKSPYRVLVERMRQGAVTVDPDGVVVYTNERFCAMVALPHGRIVGTRLSEFIAESDRAAFTALLAARDSAQAEIRLRASNGERPTTLATINSLEGYKMLLFADLTEQKRHEASDERTRKFLGMLAHEFRNILGPIQNSALLLKKKPLDAEALKAAEMIERQTGRLLGLVDDLGRINPKE